MQRRHACPAAAGEARRNFPHGGESIYWGSVRFFKHLILLLFALLLLAAFLLTARLAYGAGAEGGKGGTLHVTETITVSDEFQLAAQKLNEGFPEEFNRLCSEADIDAGELLAALDANGREELRAAYHSVLGSTTETPAYIALYPELSAVPGPANAYEKNMVYLTFDDGPSVNTSHILDTLAEQGVKATFFVCPKPDGSDAALLKRIVDEGHTIGVHSFSHDYDTIYTNVEAFLEDFSKASNLIHTATGVRPDIFRFPGGSVNAYNRQIYKSIVTEMTRRGFTYYDWHVDGGEEASATPDSVYRTVVNAATDRERTIVLLHDGNGNWQAAEALERIITALKQQGYGFDQLTSRVMPITFSSVW